jgi:hypothetical protein
MTTAVTDDDICTAVRARMDKRWFIELNRLVEFVRIDLQQHIDSDVLLARLRSQRMRQKLDLYGVERKPSFGRERMVFFGRDTKGADGDTEYAPPAIGQDASGQLQQRIDKLRNADDVSDVSLAVVGVLCGKKLLAESAASKVWALLLDGDHTDFNASSHIRTLAGESAEVFERKIRPTLTTRATSVDGRRSNRIWAAENALLAHRVGTITLRGLVDITSRGPVWSTDDRTSEDEGESEEKQEDKDSAEQAGSFVSPVTPLVSAVTLCPPVSRAATIISTGILMDEASTPSSSITAAAASAATSAAIVTGHQHVFDVKFAGHTLQLELFEETDQGKPELHSKEMMEVAVAVLKPHLLGLTTHFDLDPEGFVNSALRVSSRRRRQNLAGCRCP